jgi:NAD-dependent histone deacetylase SIR2
MPTTHVSPESQDELREIANGLLKARKVIVVTGAGISTNSGIPVSFLDEHSSLRYGDAFGIRNCRLGS